MNTLFVLIHISVAAINYGKAIPDIADIQGTFNSLEECMIVLNNFKKTFNGKEKIVKNTNILIFKKDNITNYYSCNEVDHYKTAE